MANVDGTYNTTVKSPLGDQQAVLTVKSDGNRFTGSQSGSLGTMDIEGDVDGDTLKWRFSVTAPMPMTLDFTATVDGDNLSGTVGTGAFGSFPMTGTRA